jgi:hypothetical protein
MATLRMKLALALGLAVVAVIGLVVIVGALLPRRHVATRAARFRMPRAELYAIVRAFEQTPRWRSGIAAVDMLPADDGRVRFRERSRHGEITYRVREDRRGEKLVIEIADPDLPFGGTWTFVLSDAAPGAELRITEDGEIKNVFFRFLARFVFGHTRTIDAYLRDLGRKTGDTIQLKS